jgi:hypothetical protein
MNAGRAQRYARWTGALFVITIVAGAFGESIVPQTLLISNDLARTAHRVASSVGIFWGELCRVPDRSHVRHYAQCAALCADSTG